MTDEHPARDTQRTRAADARVTHVLEMVERALIYVVALFLIILAGLALANTILRVAAPIVRNRDYTAAITEGIDAAFLTVILLELLHTVLRRGPLSRQLQEFLVIGITSAVRNGLEIAARSGQVNTTAHDVVVDLALNAVGVLVLVMALWLVRHQTGVAADERMDEPPTAP